MIRIFDRARRARLVLALVVAAALAVITVDFRTKGDGPLDAMGRVAVGVLGPLQEGLGRVFRPVGNFFAGFTQVPSLKDRIGELERENAGLRADREQVSDIVRENSSLRRLLGLRDRLELETVPAQVIGVAPSNFERAVFIDRGSEEGVRVGMPVIGAAGLVGRIVAVGPTSARALLVVDRSNAVAARLSRSGETGVVEGTGEEGVLRFELLNPVADPQVGDEVVTSGYGGGVYPPGIPIGRVSETPPSATRLSRTVMVRPLVDFASLDYLLVVVGGGRSPEGAG